MSIEENKSLVRDLVDAVNRQDMATLTNLISPELVGKQKDELAWIDSTWTNHWLDITDMIAEDDRVWCRLASRGIHKGEWMGIQPKGKQFTNSGVGFIRINNGRVVETEWVFDVLNHITQLGATVHTS